MDQGINQAFQAFQTATAQAAQNLEALQTQNQNFAAQIQEEVAKLAKEKADHAITIQKEKEDAMALLKKAQADFVEEKAKFEALQADIDKAAKAAKTRISLNVGGQMFAVAKETLLVPNTFFHAMLGSNNWTPDSDGSYFIDRDPCLFVHVLNFMRTGQCNFHSLATSQFKFLQIEFDFFRVEVPPFRWLLSESVILNGKMEFAKMLEVLFPDMESLKLIYSANKHGWTSQQFHQYCDGKMNTVVLVEVGNFVFGGFALAKWNEASSTYVPKNDKAFLFSLCNPTNTHLGVKFPNTGNSIYCNPGYGPTFGAGHDFYVSSGANQNDSSYTNLGHCYSHPAGLAYGSNEIQTFFCGSYTFRPTNVEVFELTL